MISLLRCAGVALGRLVLDWSVATLASVGLVVALQLGLTALQGVMPHGPAMCVAAAVLGLLITLVASRWPREEA